MNKDKALVVFDDFKIRRVYDEKEEIWCFSVVDIVAALIQQSDYQTARKYWNKLKERLKKEGSQPVTNCHQLKLPAADGKSYLTDVADPETILRIVQSVPSPRAEPFKQWLAKVGYERIQDMGDPALIFTALAELSTRQIAESVEATGMDENAEAGMKGGRIAKGARLELEQKTGRRVVSGENFLSPEKQKPKIGSRK